MPNHGAGRPTERPNPAGDDRRATRDGRKDSRVHDAQSVNDRKNGKGR